MIKKKDSKELKEYLRNDPIQTNGKGRFAIHYKVELSEMPAYIKILENLIESGFKSDYKEFEQGMIKLTEEQQAELWDYFYPGHWQEFSSLLRSSFLITLISFFEQQISETCNAVSLIVRSPVKNADFRGSVIDCSSIW